MCIKYSLRIAFSLMGSFSWDYNRVCYHISVSNLLERSFLSRSRLFIVKHLNDSLISKPLASLSLENVALRIEPDTQSYLLEIAIGCKINFNSSP